MSEDKQSMNVLMALGAVMLLGVGLGWVAFRGHARRAVTIEGRQRVVELARGLAQCAASAGPSGSAPRGLPASAGPVPASLASVAARRHASVPSDWAAPAFSCAGFAPSDPQLYRVTWERQADDRGVVRAEADLDGDGRVDSEVTQPVVCAPTCRPGALTVR